MMICLMMNQMGVGTKHDRAHLDHRNWRPGRGVTIYYNLEELFQETRTGLIFQEVIPGGEFDAHLFIDRKGETVTGVVLEKTLLKEGMTGNAVAPVLLDINARLGGNMLSAEEILDGLFVAWEKLVPYLEGGR